MRTLTLSTTRILHAACVLFLLLTTYPSFAQSTRSYERAGDAAFNQQDYNAALFYYHNALQRQENLDVKWKYAESLRMFRAYDEAERAYGQIDRADPARQKFPLVDLRLGEVQKSKGKYDSARQHLNRFVKEQHAHDNRLLTEAQRALDACVWASAQNASDRAAVEIKHLGKGINSAYSDFAPYVLGDSLYYSSYRFDKKEKKTDAYEPAQKITRLMFSTDNQRSREVTKLPINSDSLHVAHSAFSPDGKFLIFTYCRNVNAEQISCELWMTQQDMKGRWTAPVRLPEPANLNGFSTTQPFISMDKRTHYLTLWFASDRPGGQGKMDLWSMPLDTNFFCSCAAPLDYRRPMRLPKFEAPTPLRTVNTPENDITPHFVDKTQTLYFSSEGWSGFGGYDIFATAKDELGFNAPRNLGKGLNTSYNDLYFCLKADGKTGYLSSNRPGSLYLDETSKACCNDLFTFKVLDTTLIKPFVYTPIPTATRLSTKEVPNAVSSVKPLAMPMAPKLSTTSVEKATSPTVRNATEMALGDFKGLKLYFANDEPEPRRGRYTYRNSVTTYLSQAAVYQEKAAKGPNGDAQRTATEIFFMQEVKGGYERLQQFCTLLHGRLQSGKLVDVVLKGHTSPLASSNYNLQLSKRRIRSVYYFLEEFEGGILHSYLGSGQLRVVEEGRGEADAPTTVSDNWKDIPRSVYDLEAARERRVEIVDIRER